MKNNFELTIFLPDTKINARKFSISHDDLKSAAFVRLDMKYGEPCAIYCVEMNNKHSIPSHPETMFLVSHSDYDVNSDDIYVDLYSLPLSA